MPEIDPSERTSGQAGWPLQVGSLEPLVATPPSPDCEVCVIIPVRDEAESLTATLQALACQVDLTGQPLGRSRYEIILLANNCCDDSAAIATAFAHQYPSLALYTVEKTLPPTEAHVGRARKLLMDEAYRRLAILNRRRGVIASTDGDTRVTPTWIAATLAEIDRGADAVGGRILTDRASRLGLDSGTRLYYLRDVGYRQLVAELETYLDPVPCDRWPRHYQHFGASLAVTAEMYARVGGLPAVRTPEDAAFYRALLRVDARFRHSPIVCVLTSARQVGRATLGLAAQLDTWAEMGRQGQPYLVEPVPAIIARLQTRQRLRKLWWQTKAEHSLLRGEAASLAADLGVAVKWLIDHLRQLQTFGLLLEQIEPDQQQGPAGYLAEPWPPVEIQQAICDLRLRLAGLRPGGHQGLDSLKQVKSVLRLTPTAQMPQANSYPLQERVVDLISR